MPDGLLVQADLSGSMTGRIRSWSPGRSVTYLMRSRTSSVQSPCGERTLWLVSVEPGAVSGRNGPPGRECSMVTFMSCPWGTYCRRVRGLERRSGCLADGRAGFPGGGARRVGAVVEVDDGGGATVGAEGGCCRVGGVGSALPLPEVVSELAGGGAGVAQGGGQLAVLVGGRSRREGRSGERQADPRFVSGDSLCGAPNYAELVRRPALTWAFAWRGTPHSQRPSKKLRSRSVAVKRSG